MTTTRRGFLASAPAAYFAAYSTSTARPDVAATKDESNVIFVTTDGLRWQEVFRGADEALLNKEAGGVADIDALRRDFWRDSLADRREALLPFLWQTFVPGGQLFGNLDSGCEARVTNGKNFSYPGYNELLTGAPDPRVDSNDKRDNANVTVLEWLNRKPAFQGRVAASCTWDVFPYIINEKRSGVPVRAAWEPVSGHALTPRQSLLNQLLSTTHRPWNNMCFDSFTVEAALEEMRVSKPRLLYLALGETDHFAHEGRYDHYLHSAHRFDQTLRRIWETVQELPEYRDKTSLLISTDHGRGDPPTGWKSHSATIKGAEFIWIGAIGPRTPKLGMRANTSQPVTQSQLAATLAALVGEDFPADNRNAAPPIVDLIRS